MGKGDTYPAEWSEFLDTETGARVRKLTDHLCHSSHFYFTNPPWYSGGRGMLFHSNRGNSQNLFGMDMGSGEIRQLTGFGPGEAGVKPFGACASMTHGAAYFQAGRTIRSLDLTDLGERTVCSLPDGWLAGPPACSSDGRWLYWSEMRDESEWADRSEGPKKARGYRELWAAHPRCRIVRVPTGGGGPETLWEEDNWIGHVNPCPTRPEIITFCHEGPWSQVDHRIWGMDISTSQVWRIGPSRRLDQPPAADPPSPGYVIGHEYWFADGSRIGYHGKTGERVFIWGHADPFGGGWTDLPTPRRSLHQHSLDDKLAVGDGLLDYRFVILWRWRDGEPDGRLLCRHGCSSQTQQLNVHPAITPGGGVLYTSDMSGYGNIYLAEIPDLDSLPPCEGRTA